MAQSPNRMREIMERLFFATNSFGASTECSTQSLFTLLILVVYGVLVKRYKLKERDKHINLSLIAEEHHERYFDQGEKK